MTEEQKLENIDDSIYLLFREGILTFSQRRNCDKKMYGIIKKNNVKYDKKIRSHDDKVSVME